MITKKRPLESLDVVHAIIQQKNFHEHFKRYFRESRVSEEDADIANVLQFWSA